MIFIDNEECNYPCSNCKCLIIHDSPWTWHCTSNEYECYKQLYLQLNTIKILQERLKGRNTLGCLDQYAAQNSKYAKPPIPSQPPTQKVFFQYHTQYDPTMKHSHCETVYAQELFQWLFFELVHSLRIL